MENKKEFLIALREYLDSCFMFHHEQADIEHKATTNIPNHDMQEILNGELAPSSGLCKQSTFVCKIMLNNLFGENWSVGGGHMLKKDTSGFDWVKKSHHKEFLESDTPKPMMGGALLVNNKMEVFGTHWWLERDGIIIDLSADQFGHDSVIITTTDDNRYIKNSKRSGLHAIALNKDESLIWANNKFNKLLENKETNNVQAAYKKLRSLFPEIENKSSSELSI